ncbi:MAG: NUDIX domain-containing protein [Bacteroidales bacterium]|nr:NUDIX domain-containing protein [Bacteroidales bacterium]
MTEFIADKPLSAGSMKKEDYTLLETALRETREEIGVDVKEEQVAGKLTDIYVPPSNFLVTPYVALIKEVPQMKKDLF